MPEKEAASDAVLVWFFQVIAMFVPSVNRLGEIPAKVAFIFHMDPNLARTNQENAPILDAESAHIVLTELADRVRAHVGQVSATDFSTWMIEIETATGVSGNALNQPVRIALTGSLTGLDFDKLIPIIEQGAELNVGIPSIRERLDAFLEA